VVEVVSFISHRKGGAMVHPHDRNMNGDWEELRVDFCHSFFLTERIDSLPIDILDFEQLEKESIGAIWVRFLRLLASSSDLSTLDDVSLNIYSILDMKSALDLNDTARGLFAHKTPTERREILDKLLRKLFLPY